MAALLDTAVDLSDPEVLAPPRARGLAHLEEPACGELPRDQVGGRAAAPGHTWGGLV